MPITAAPYAHQQAAFDFACRKFGLLPSDFFGRMAGLYVLYVVLLALIFAFIKWFIGFLGRPHRF